MNLSDYGMNINKLSGVRSIMADIENTLARCDSNFINLSAGNPVILEEVAELWRKHSNDFINSEEFAEILCRYSSTRGIDRFVRAIVNLMNTQHGFKICEKNILVAPGSQLIYFYAINAFAGLNNRNRAKVLFPLSPEYTGYSNMGINREFLHAQKPKIEIIDKHTFKYLIDFDSLDLQDVGVVILSRPCNPSGNIITDDELRRLIRVTKEKEIPLIIDSAYGPPMPNLSYTNIELVMDENVIHVLSLSKVGVPGFRLGVAIGKEELINVLYSFQSNACIMSSTFGQAVASRCIETGELENICKSIIKKYYKNKLDLTEKYIRKYFHDSIPYYIHKSEGSFFKWIWFKDLPISDKELYQKLKERHVIIVPGSSFFPGIKDNNWRHQEECIRISVTASNEDLCSGIKVMGDVLKEVYFQ